MKWTKGPLGWDPSRGQKDSVAKSEGSHGRLVSEGGLARLFLAILLSAAETNESQSREGHTAVAQESEAEGSALVWVPASQTTVN